MKIKQNMFSARQGKQTTHCLLAKTAFAKKKNLCTILVQKAILLDAHLESKEKRNSREECNQTNKKKKRRKNQRTIKRRIKNHHTEAIKEKTHSQSEFFQVVKI